MAVLFDYYVCTSCWGNFSICQYSHTKPNLAGWLAMVCISVNSSYENISLSLNSTSLYYCSEVMIQIITKTSSILLCCLYQAHFSFNRQTAFLISSSSCMHTLSCRLSAVSIMVWCHLVWLVEPHSLPSGEAISDPSFSLNPCFRHAKLTAALWVNAACECWDGRGMSEWKAPITATCMVLHDWLHSVFFKGPSPSLCLSLTAGL